MAPIQGKYTASQEQSGAEALIRRLLLACDSATTGYDSTLRVG